MFHFILNSLEPKVSTTFVEIANCFGKDYKSLQTCFLKLNEGYSLWCPKLHINKGRKEKIHSNC